MKYLFAVLFLLHTNVYAANLEGDDRLARWEFGAGVSTATINEYIGSTHRNFYLLPFPYFIYRGDRFSVDKKLLRTRLFNSEHSEFGLSLGGATPADSREDGLRSGMPDIDPALEVGALYEHRFYGNEKNHLNFIYEIPLRAVFAGNFSNVDQHGYVTTPRIKAIKHFYTDRGKHKLSFSVGPVFATADYHDYYYGVDTQYVTPERNAFEGESGYSGTRLTASYGFSRNKWWLGGFVRYWNADGSKFEDSPLIDTTHNVAAGFAIGWVIKQKFAEK